MPYCSECGSKVEESDKFCKSCGTTQEARSSKSANQQAHELQENIEFVEELLEPESNFQQTKELPVSMDKLKESLESAPPVDDKSRTSLKEAIYLIKEFKNIVPEKFYYHYLELCENYDPKNESEIKRLSDQLTLIFKNYLKMVRSPHERLPDEDFLWKYDELKEEGISKGEFSKTWIITNLRVCVVDFDTHLEKCKGLLLSNTEVMNLNRNPDWKVIGDFLPQAQAYGIEVYPREGGRKRNSSKGDLVFSFQGKETFRLTGITDPEEVQKLVENVKKQQRALLNG